MADTNIDSVQPDLYQKPRKLIVCIDGTSNQFSKRNTHVVELYSRIKKDATQLTYYSSGIGTYARPFMWSLSYQKQQLLNVVDLAIAWNFEKVIVGAYRWLADVYQTGDQIFLFGFSRGAYQVQTLAAMIERIGLIYPGNQEQIPFAWAVYSNKDENTDAFKKAFCRDKVDLHFMGVWDTVASVGVLPRPDFPLMERGGYITHFRHALALDELRVKFLPEHLPHKEGRTQTSKEVWFSGTHSDVGGGAKDNSKLDRGGEPLKWMIEEAHEQGLSIRLHDIKIGIPNAEVTNSMGWAWTILEILPMQWRKYLPGGSSNLRRLPHLMRPREVLPHQTVHWTVRASLTQAHTSGETTGSALTRLWSPQYMARARILSNNVSDPPVQSWIDAIKTDKAISGRNLPLWTDDHEFTKMIDILKLEKSLPDDEWFDKLKEYVLGDVGKPEVIWAYGGPQLLQRLFARYPKNKETAKIARAVIGFDPKIRWDQSTKKYDFKPKGPKLKNEGDKKREMNMEECMERLHNMVIPRICLLLEEWMKDRPKSEPKSTKLGFCAWVMKTFGFADAEPSDSICSVDTNWSWNWVPKKDRSFDLAILVANIVSEIPHMAQISETNVEELIDLTIAMIPASPDGEIPPITDQAQEETMSVVLVVMNALLLHNISKDRFNNRGVISSLLPLIRTNEANSKLTLQTLHAVGVLSQGLRLKEAHLNTEIISVLLDLMEGGKILDPATKLQLGSVASTTLVSLSRNDWCYWVLTRRDSLKKLSEISERSVDIHSILRALRNTPINYYWYKSGKPAQELKDRQLYVMSTFAESERLKDTTVRLYACLIGNEIDGGPHLEDRGVSTEVSEALRKAFRKLVKLLSSRALSQDTKQEILCAIIRFGLQGLPGKDHSNTFRDWQDILKEGEDALTPMAQSGEKRAILAILAVYTSRELKITAGVNSAFIDRYFGALLAMIQLEDCALLQGALEVLTLLIRKGYTPQDNHARELIENVGVIIKAAYHGPSSSWYSLEAQRVQDLIVHGLARKLIAALESHGTTRLILQQSGLSSASLSRWYRF